jgi:tetratricopeptide (TPR) repeat protein
MRHFISAIVLAAIVLCGCSKSPETLPQDVPGLVKLLGSDDAAMRQKALGALATLPPERFEDIEGYAAMNLPAPAGPALDALVKRLRPIMPARQRLRQKSDDQIRAYTNSTLDQYGQFGIHSDKWDNTAREFIQTIASSPSSEHDRIERADKLIQNAADLRKAGCSDPFILYLIAKIDGDNVKNDEERKGAINEFQSAISALEQSNYPVMRKCYAHARYLEFALKGKLNGIFPNWKDDLEPDLALALKEWPIALRDPALSNWLAFELAQSLSFDIMKMSWDGKAYGDRGQVYTDLVPAWQTARPDDVGPLLFTGSLYIDYAWDARGGDYAAKVTANGWQLMQDRLKVARTALEKAYAMDPQDPRAATLMINVVLGQQTGREDMDLWFNRAMTANPDNFAACQGKLTFLEPKWNGSPDDMIAFGRQCRDGGNFEGRIPFVLTEAYYRLSAYYQKPTDLYHSPGVWDDIRSVYEPELALYPDSIYDRSYFAYYAFMCGQMSTARDQFKILGDHPLLEPFGTRQQYDDMVKQAGQ